MTRHNSKLTVKGQVTIPKDVRDALGLRSGEPVEFDWNASGEAVIRKGGLDEAERSRRIAEFRNRISDVSTRYAHLRTGRETDAYMAEIRASVPTPDPEDV